jgi:hypothetical protein
MQLYFVLECSFISLHRSGDRLNIFIDLDFSSPLHDYLGGF